MFSRQGNGLKRRSIARKTKTLAYFTLSTGILFGGISLISGSTAYADTTSWDFQYTGSVQSFTAPYTGTYEFQVWGAQGGNDYNNVTGTLPGGNGGYAEGDSDLTAGQTVYIYVGSQGQQGDSSSNYRVYFAGGWNGGGRGNGGGGGGGATDIRKQSGSNWYSGLSSRVIVAGGGGGSYTYNYWGNHNNRPGGYGGGLTGETLTAVPYASVVYGGTQTNAGQNGGLGYGGTNNSAAPYGAGGGGGYYGGGGYGSDNGGGGGSSYIGGVSNGETASGNQQMPSSSGGTETGQSGNGFARITLVKPADTTPPVTTAATSGNQGSNGWYTSPVQLTLSATDDSSGVANTYYSTNGGTLQTYTSPISFSIDGKYSIQYYSVDNDGNKEASQSISFNIDQTAPSTQSSVSGNQGNNGWYVGPVQLSLSATDNESGVAATYYSTDGDTWKQYTSSINFSTDGKYTMAYYSVDNAGNKETTRSVALKIDQTPASISVTSPSHGSYLDNQSPMVTYSVTDNMSGVNNASVVATLDGQPINNGTTIALYTLSLGSHTLSVSATDNAGNTATQSVTFQVNTSIDSIKNLVSQFAGNGWIDNSGLANALTAKLDAGNLQAFVNQVEAQSGKRINASAAKYLLRDANYLLGQ